MTTATTPPPAVRESSKDAGKPPVSSRQTHFAARHVGPRASDLEAMLGTVGYDSLDALVDAVIPDDIRLRRPLALLGAFVGLTGVSGWCPAYHYTGVTSLGGPGDRPDEAVRDTWIVPRDKVTASVPADLENAGR